jgi:uncharacterized protein
MILANCAIVIMAKYPEAGKVKTRLQPFFTECESAELAKCFLQDTVNKALCVTKNVIIAYSPSYKQDEFSTLLSGNVTFIAQNGVDLGDRMLNAFQCAFKQNFNSVLMIGTDSPSFPTEFLEQSFKVLKENDAVIGETIDGGFYLIGLNKLYTEIFNAVEWSSSKTFLQTKSNFKKLEISFSELPVFFDVDVPQDLKRLQEDMLLHTFAPITYQFLTTKRDTKL